MADLERTGSRLDAFVDRYAARTRGMAASEIRALFAVASRPEVVSLAGGMPYVSALPLDVVGRGDRRDWSPSAAPWPCSTAPARATPRLREQICEVMPTSRASRAPRRRRRHRRLAAGAGPGHPDLLRPRRRGARPRRRPTSARSATFAGLPGATSCTSRWTTTGWCPRRCARRIGAAARRRQAGQVPLHDPELPQPGRRHAVRPAAAGGARRSAASRRARARGRPLRPAGLRRRSPPRAMRADDADGVDLPRLVLQDLRPRAARGLGARAARRAGEARARRRVRVLCPPAFNQLAVSGVPRRRTTGSSQVKAFREIYRERRDAMLDALDDLMPAGTTWTGRAAASTSG